MNNNKISNPKTETPIGIDLNDKEKNELSEEDQSKLNRAAVDFISGMMDDFAKSMYKRYYNIDFDAITIPEDERYEYIKSKTVLDSDGWRTDYTMYYDYDTDRFIFIFGLKSGR